MHQRPIISLPMDRSCLHDVQARFYLSTQKNHCREVLHCLEEDKFYPNAHFPKMNMALYPRPCKHVIIASEPTGDETSEEIPDGGLISIDAYLMMRLHHAQAFG